MRALIRRLLQSGASRAVSAWDARRVVLLNALCLATIGLGVISLPVSLLAGTPEALPANLSMQAFAAFIVWLNARGRAWAAAGLFCMATAVAVALQLLVVGDGTGIHHWFVPVMIVPFLVFPADRTRWAVALSAAIFVSFSGVVAAEWGLDADHMGRTAANVFSALAMLGVSAYSRVATLSTERDVDAERARADALLANVLPRAVAAELQAGTHRARRHDAVTVLFADLVSFTTLAERMPPDEIVALLDRVFRAFDACVERRGLEKIKTIGDAYMAAAGVPEARPDHAEAAADLALDLLDAVEEINATTGRRLLLRVGLGTGPVVAGVIGERRLQYDLWSDAVNVAARMESHGIPGGVQVDEATAELLAAAGFPLRARGHVDVKGKGAMETHLLVGRRRSAGTGYAPET